MHAHILTIDLIRHFVEAHAVAVYFVIFFGVIIEGEIVVILAGIFSHLGSVNLFLAFCVVILAGISKSIIGYFVGYQLQKHHSHRSFIKYMEKRISYFLPRFKERPFWSIFVARFLVLGLHWFTIIFSGFKKIELKTYIKAELSSLCAWAVAMLSIGFIFSYAALSVSHDIRKLLGLLLLFFIAFFILEKIVAFILEVMSGTTPTNES